MQKRRDFIKAAGFIGGCVALNPVNAFGLNNQHLVTKPFGIQLYTLRDIIIGKEEETIKSLASFGYTQLESYEGPKGVYWGMSPSTFKNFTEDLGIKMISTHCNVYADFEKKVEEAASIGLKYLICPWVGPQKTIDDFKKIAAQFNEKGNLCKKYGIRFAYHNHDYSFKSMNGIYPQDILMKETDSNLVDFEMDMYWVVTAGEDPMAWLKRYPNRFHLAHIKDRSRTPINQGQYESVDLGTGSINYPALLKNAKQWGLNYLFMEQEFYPNGSPLLAAETGAGYLKKIKF